MTKFALTYRNYYDIKSELSKVSWSHNIILMSKLNDENERNWYMNQSIENGWSRSVLNHQIEYGLYASCNSGCIIGFWLSNAIQCKRIQFLLGE